mmetsp:Transcript_21032/g.52680  ORF Transcript_21032/g.52680 Transcript_21032/m.52680 type:complete len:305 (+) Transcript_21032:429-1343(+)
MPKPVPLGWAETTLPKATLYVQCRGSAADDSAVNSNDCRFRLCLANRRTPRERAFPHQGKASRGCDCQEAGANSPRLPVTFRLQQRADCQGGDGHELDQDVQRRTGRVLERISDGVSNDARLPDVLLLDAQLFTQLLRVVPCATSIGHRDAQQASRCRGPRERPHEAPWTDEEADRQGRKDREQSRGEHLLDRCPRGQGHASVTVWLDILLRRDGLALRCAPDGIHQRETVGIPHLTELPSHLLDDLSRGLADGEHGESPEEVWEHGANQDAGQNDGVADVKGALWQVDLVLERSKQGQRCEHR